QAMEFLGMAGWDTTQIMAGLPDVLNLAAAGGLGLAEAADIASNIMAGMSMEASEVGRAADALAKAAASANVDVRMLGETGSIAAKSSREWGMQIRASSGAVRRLDELLIDLTNSEADAAEIARAFGADHGPKLVSAMQQGESAIRKLVDALGEASGEAERME